VEINLEINLKLGKTVDNSLQLAIQGEKEKRRSILKVILDAILFCAKNNLALRGKTENIGESGSGIFLSTIELISHYHTQLAQHIEAVKGKKHNFLLVSTNSK